ncbi:MAG: ATP synthase F1 subunit delta [Oscillospiraceae bacterium]|nr:ATP synthase F1 subunit delta [Oscillospiraceae bacterium]
MTQIAKNYADALYELARDERLDEEIYGQLRAVRELLDTNPDYVRLLSAPNLPKPERLAALDEAFSGKVHPYLLSFLKLLCERGHIRELKDCCVQYRRRRNADLGILDAVAITAVPLRAELQEKLRLRLQTLTGKQVDLQYRTDPSVLGGIRLEYDGKALDGTVRNRLAGIEKTLSETVI